MHILRKILLLEKIYAKKTLGGFFYDGLILLILGVFVAHLSGKYPAIAMILVILLSYIILREIVRSIIVNLRTRDINYRMPLSIFQSKFFRSATNDELNNVDGTKLLAEGEDWKIFDARFDMYRKAKHGDILSKQLFYTVMELKLNRAVPNLIFDSKHAKGQQFRYTYLGSQKLSLEGNFDTYFTTYAPQYYKIDTLSFITPEVMHELIAASAYDIELIEDRLFMYAPLADKHQLDQLQSIGKRLQTALNDNLDTYRDSYIAGNGRATETTPFARKLLKSPLKAWLSLVGICSVFGVLTILAFTGSSQYLFSQFGIIVVIGILANGYKLRKILKENHQMQANFNATRNYLELLNSKKGFR